MRLNLTLFFLLLLSCTTQAQKLTGIWRGYFSSTSGGIYKGATREETYKYEIQIDQQSNDGVRGVTYSYKSTIFYGKAELQGIFTGSSKSIVFKETKLVDLKIGDKSEPCLMTCYLDYSKIGKLEVLEGSFISINVKDKSDCGSGKVYLERVPTSDFKLEDFLVKKKPQDSDRTSGKIFIAPKTTTPPVKNVPQPGVTNRDKKDNLVTKPAPLKPSGGTQRTAPPAAKNQSSKGIAGQQINPQQKKDDKPIVPYRQNEKVQEETVNSDKKETFNAPQVDHQVKKAPIPKVLQERENNLVSTITTAGENIEINFFDNGTIDNDTISVYHNNQLEVSHGRLTTSAIVMKITASKTDSRHELVIVADNLGDIPPNTALMVIKTKERRYEVYLTSNEERNAKVVINYVPKE